MTVGGCCNDLISHFMNLSLISPFDASRVCIFGYVACRSVWFGFGRFWVDLKHLVLSLEMLIEVLLL